MKAMERLRTCIGSSFPGVAITTYEDDQVEKVTSSIVAELNALGNKINLISWSATTGIKIIHGELKNQPREPRNIQEVLTIFIDLGKKKLAPVDRNMPVEQYGNDVLLLKNFAPLIETGGTAYINQCLLKDLLALTAEGAAITVIMTDVEFNLPPRVERLLSLIQWPLPDRKEVKSYIRSMLDGSDIVTPPEELDRMVDACLGLTLKEVGNVCGASIYEMKCLSPELAITEKKAIVKKAAKLTIYEPQGDLTAVGGLENLKDWLRVRKEGMTEAAKEYGLTPPKGIILTGIPGGGKSLISRCIGKEWNLPVLALDFGAIMGSFVGESESNLRRALDVSETLAPCVLHIDEIDKGLGSAGGGGDSGTSQRVFGKWLQWMADKTAPVFVVATANRLDNLPPEATRAGRFDVVFYVDFPNTEEREAIFIAQLKKRKRAVDEFDIIRLAQSSDGYTGAETDAAIENAMFVAFSEQREVNSDDIIGALSSTPRIKDRMGDKLRVIREGLIGAVPASKPEIKHELLPGNNLEQGGPSKRMTAITGNKVFKKKVN